MKERAGPLPGYVTHEDPTTGELLYRARTPEDGVLPGDRRVFEGIIDGGNGDEGPWCEFDFSRDGVSQDGWFSINPPSELSDMKGKRVRITVEVLEDEPRE